jgi:translocator protein
MVEFDPLWYENLKKSQLSPPNYVFGIVWPILYTMMFVALILVLRSVSIKSKAVLLFAGQLFLNLIWSPIFFTYKLYSIALLDILLLIIVLGFTIIAFYKISHVAAYLLVPYLLWLSFASYLNTYIVMNN